MPMLADVADAVIGVDTHADNHALQIAGANGVPIAECTITNDENGYAEAIAFAEHHAPGPRVFFAIEGTRSYRRLLHQTPTASDLVNRDFTHPAP